jgi:hypothetical protein
MIGLQTDVGQIRVSPVEIKSRTIELMAGNGMVTYADTPKSGCYGTKLWSDRPPQYLACNTCPTRQQHHTLFFSVHSRSAIRQTYPSSHGSRVLPSGLELPSDRIRQASFRLLPTYMGRCRCHIPPSAREQLELAQTFR